MRTSAPPLPSRVPTYSLLLATCVSLPSTTTGNAKDGNVDERAARDPADDHIRESAESFTSLFEATSEGMVIVEQGRIIAANRTYAALLGREPGELIGLPALDFIA